MSRLSTGRPVKLAVAALGGVVSLLLVAVAVGGVLSEGISSAASASGSAAPLVKTLGISPVLADAYDQALVKMQSVVPGCRIRLALVAAVVEQEAASGRGRTISPTGDLDPRIIGEPLDGGVDAGGNPKALINDTDGGRWDGDTTYDHAVGIAQFIPSTWAASGLDGNDDGVADPHDVYDAVLSQAAKLCRDGFPLASADDERRALYAYNPAEWYVTHVLALADQIQVMLDQASPADTSDSATTIDRPEGPLELKTVQGITVASHIAPHLEQLLDAARRDGFELSGSGYRSAELQAQLRVANGCPDVHTAPPESCRVPTAIPGTSMHEKGEAVDFTWQGSTIGSHDNLAFQWLAANAAKFGFYNLPSEPWHWSATGS